MIPNITKGDRMGGLMSYLTDTDPERTHNVHSDPHLVAGTSSIMAWHDDTELSRKDALDVARQLDQPRRAYDMEVAGGTVWHCSLSIRAEEGQLTDEQWGNIARDFMDEMDFTEAGGKAPARWVAVRHGLSRNGNDHIHIAASRVREDGTKVSVHMDQPRAQKAARAIALKYGLEGLESARAERSTRGFKAGERETAARHGRPETARATLARRVRACSIASADEAEFVRRLRGDGVLVRPRYASDRTDVVTGYSVALRPDRSQGERPIWYGGLRLGNDLTLPALRQGWPDTPEVASEAVAEWNAATRHQRPAKPGRERHEVSPEQWDVQTRRVAALNDRLASVPVDDRDTWAQVAREASGMLAAWSRRAHPDSVRDLETAADSFAITAQLRRRPVRAPRGESGIAGAALAVAAMARGGQGTTAQLALLQQMLQLGKAMYRMHKALSENHRAASMLSDVRSRLAAVEARMPRPVEAGQQRIVDPVPDALRRATQGVAPATQIGSPIPIVLPPTQDVPARRTSTQESPRGPER